MDEVAYREAERLLWEWVGISPEETRVPCPVAGTDVRVQIVGDGPSVLFIHGGPNAGSTWAGILPHFSGFRSYIVDRPGTGLSGDFVLLDDMMGFSRRFVPELLDELGIEHTYVVASSFGGMLALVGGAVAGERLDRMVQMACPAFVPGFRTPPFMRAMSLAPVRWLMNTLPPNERVGKSILRQIGHGASLDADRIPQVFFDWYLALQKHTNTMRNEGEMIGSAATLRGFTESDTLPDELFASVATPTLFLWGEDDAFGGQDVAENVVRLMPNAELRMLPDSGHLPWLDDPHGIGAMSAEFFREP